MARNHPTKRKQWIKFWALFVPLFAVWMIAVNVFGFLQVLPSLTAFLGLTLLFQRFVKQRSWHSIIWSDDREG